MSRKTDLIKEEKRQKSIQAKKIFWVIVLLIFVGGVSYALIQKPTVTSSSNSPQFVQKNENESGDTIETEETAKTVNTMKTTVKKELNDGTLYSLVGNKKILPDIVIGDNYFDTQLTDIYNNFKEYKGKTIEVEGFYLENTPYTFVGRYAENSLCPYCPQGYSYFEYEWHGDQELHFTNEEEWLKIVGTLKSNIDNGEEYFYIDVATLEVMNERGVDTVKN